MRSSKVLAFLFGCSLCSATVAQSPSSSVCPTCRPRTDLTTGAADKGRAGSAASMTDCKARQVPLTAAVSDTFGVETLRDFLATPHTFEAELREGRNAGARSRRNVTVEVRFELGEVSAYEVASECIDYVTAPVHLQVRVGNGLLAFAANGVMFKGEGEALARFYAAADLAAATGDFEPEIDVSRLHIGQIETSMHVAPGHLRGQVQFEAIYFKDDTQLRDHQSGLWWDYAEFDSFATLHFPDDDCYDSELPFRPDEPIAAFSGRSADQLRAAVERLIGDAATADAVWRDGTTTDMRVHIGKRAGRVACLRGDTYQRDGAANASSLLRMAVQGRVRSGDGRIDMPLDELTVWAVSGEIARAELSAPSIPAARLSRAERRALGVDADVLDALIRYDFEPAARRSNGRIYLYENVTPGWSNRADCVAFPPGSALDTDCRYAR